MATNFDLGLVDGNVWSAAHVNSIEAIINALKDVTNADHLAALAALHAPASLGVKAWLQQSASHTGIAATEVDIANFGAFLIWTATASRLYRVTLHLGNVIKLTTGDGVRIKITDGANVVKAESQVVLVTGEQTTMNVVEIVSGLSGSITRKARASTASGTVTVNKLTGQTTVFYVEDIGAA